MSLILILVRLALVAVFGVAGFAKLLDRRGTREAVINFGAPAKFADTLTLLLPLCEIGIAIGLVLQNLARWSAVAALVLLGTFIAAIGFNLARGRAPDCHCFGQLHSRPLSLNTLLRNIAFALGAGLIVWQGSRAPDKSLLILSSELGVNDLIVLAAWLIIALAAGGMVLLRLRSRTSAVVSPEPSAAQGLPIGALAPTFELATYHRTRSSLEELLNPGKPLLLMFSNPNCGPCVALFQEVAEWQRAYVDEITIAVFSQGTIKENFVNVARNELKNVLLQQEREVAESYRAKVTPTAVIVSADGKIASGVAAGADEIRNLIRTALGASFRLTADHAAGLSYLPQPSTQNAD